MKKIAKLIGILCGILGVFFAVTFTVYFFNLDMKLTSALEPYLDKIYDRRERDKTL